MSDPGTPNQPTEPTREQAFVAKLLGLKDATGTNVRKLARDLYPDAPVPAEDPEVVVAPLKQEVGELKDQLKTAMERIAARDKADADLKVESDLSVKLSAARNSFGLTDSGYEKMVTRMKETGNYQDAEAAAAWVVSQTPKPEPTSSPSWMPEPANFFGAQQKDEQFEALHKNPVKYFDDQLREFFKNPDKYVAETFGTA